MVFLVDNQSSWLDPDSDLSDVIKTKTWTQMGLGLDQVFLGPYSPVKTSRADQCEHAQ